MTPPVAKVEFLRLRVRLVRRERLRIMERAIYVVALCAGLMWLATRLL